MESGNRAEVEAANRSSDGEIPDQKAGPGKLEERWPKEGGVIVKGHQVVMFQPS